MNKINFVRAHEKGKKPRMIHLFRFISNTGLNIKFTFFYALFVFLPTFIFLAWYSMDLTHDRRMEYKNEKLQVLDQSLKIIESQLLLTESITMNLQSNASLSKLLQNQYLNASDELFEYLSIIRPTLTGFSVFHPFLDNLFLYRYSDSILTNSDFIHYINPIHTFPYGDELLERIYQENMIWHVAMTNKKTEPTYNRVENNLKLVCFSKLYDKTYSNVIGILELQVGLDKICNTMNFLSEDDYLYLNYMDSTYLVSTGGNADRLQIIQQQDLSHVLSDKHYDVVSMALDKTNLIFHYQYSVGKLDIPPITQLLPAFLLLLLPTFLFLFLLYRFTGKMVRFSNHIKNTHGSNLSQFDENVSMDEFGIVVSEFNTMTCTINNLIRTVYQMEKQKNEANYYAMQSQIDPHFLFNTLENIRMQIDMKAYETVGEMLFALSRLMRYNMSMRRESTIIHEINHIKNYLFIYHSRQKNRISFNVEVDEQFQDIPCPFCILQPIVENSIKHGIKHATDSVHIDISLVEAPLGVTVLVKDTGGGISTEKIRELNEALRHESEIDRTNIGLNIGLGNVNSRIKYYYGDKYGLSFSKNEPQGVICEIKLGLSPETDTIKMIEQQERESSL